jgi:hypothetical protein
MGSQELQKEENCNKNYGLFEVTMVTLTASESMSVGHSLAPDHPEESV